MQGVEQGRGGEGTVRFVFCKASLGYCVKVGQRMKEWRLGTQGVPRGREGRVGGREPEWTVRWGGAGREASRRKPRAISWRWGFMGATLRRKPWRSKSERGKGKNCPFLMSLFGIYLCSLETPFPGLSKPVLSPLHTPRPPPKSIPIMYCFCKQLDNLVNTFQPMRTGLRSLKPSFPGVAWRKLPPLPLGDNLSCR